MTTAYLTTFCSDRRLHTKEDCPRLTGCDDYHSVEKEDYQHYPECKVCQEGTEAYSGGGGTEAKPCPYCGELVKRYHMHLPECEQA
jgi:hypothetical protein